MRIVVTGGSGKAGRWVVRDLRDNGHDVLNVDWRRDESAHGQDLVTDALGHRSSSKCARISSAAPLAGPRRAAHRMVGIGRRRHVRCPSAAVNRVWHAFVPRVNETATSSPWALLAELDRFIR
jgi:nucleoside-diphosphate-sugar epimerase